MLLRILAILAILAAVPVGAGVVASSTNRSTGSGGTSFTGGTITSPILAPTGTPVPYSFTGKTTSGLFFSTNTDAPAIRDHDIVALVIEGANNGIKINPALPLSWGADGGTSDLFLYRDAANTLAQRNSTNAQTFNWYYSYTDASNYQRGALKTSASGIEIAAETAGSGADNLNVTLTPAGTGQVIAGGAASETVPQIALSTQATTGIGQGQVNYISFLVNGSAKWTIDSGGTLQPGGSVPNSDAQDIGLFSGSTVYPVRSLALARSIQGSKTKALTETSATAVTQIAVPQTAGTNFADAVVQWTVYATDGTDTQTRRGSTYLAAVNKAGTETCTVGDIGTPVVAVSAGTLTCTTSCITGLTDVVQFALDCTSSLTQSTLNALVRLDMDQPNTVTPQ